MKAALVLALAALSFAATGCLRGGDRDSDDDPECVRDSDCDGECTRTNECVEAGTAIRVEVDWTINGAEPDELSCAPIAELEVIFYDDDERGPNYAPIPCPIGSSTYDKMPPRLDLVEILAYDDGGEVIDQENAVLSPTATTVVTFTLEL